MADVRQQLINWRPGKRLSAGAKFSRRQRLLSWLLIVIVLAPALLLLTTLRENRRTAVQLADVNLSGSLRFRSLWLYGAGRDGEDWHEQWGKMQATRADLQSRYPAAVAATEPQWQAFSSSLARTGRVDWRTADALRLACNALTQSIEALAHRQEARTSTLLSAGLIGMAICLLGVSLLLRGLWLAEMRQTEAHQVLEESRLLFSSSLDAMQEGFLVQDGDGTVLLCNPRAEHILHLKSAEYVGKMAIQPKWRIIAEDGSDLPREQHPSRIALRTGLPQPAQTLGLVETGKDTQWLLLQAAPLFHVDDERPYAAVVTFADVSDRTRTETALRRSEDRMRRLQDLTTTRGLTLDQKRDALLHLGCEFFDLPVAVIAHCTNGRHYEVMHSVSPDNAIPAGMSCGLEETYCSQVICTEAPQAQAHIGTSDWRDLPAYAAFGLESYLGAPLWVGETLYGSLCFAAADPCPVPFSEADLDTLRLMAQWLGGELAREEAREQIESYNIVLEFQMRELAKANAELEALATQDGLTGLKNRRTFGERLEEEAMRAARYGTPLSLVMLDVDHFKQYNDAFGHPEGDEVLRTVARQLSTDARESDLAARYGGEEFVILLPQTDSAGACVIAERVRMAVCASDWPHRPVTASFGVATLTPGMSAGDLVTTADQALYRAKAEGRNRVSLHVSDTAFSGRMLA